MKKNYEKMLIVIRQFEKQDIIMSSSSNPENFKDFNEDWLD